MSIFEILTHQHDYLIKRAAPKFYAYTETKKVNYKAEINE